MILKMSSFWAAAVLGAAGALAASDSQPLEPSERAAKALYEGDQAFSANKPDRRKLVVALSKLNAIGGHPADATEANVAEVWRTRMNRADLARLAVPAYRGRILGPAYRSGFVAPGVPISTTQLFLAGQVASLSVAPSKDAKLGLTVINAKGAEICTSKILAPASSCRWIPTFSERVQIRIENVGAAPAKYFLAVN